MSRRPLIHAALALTLSAGLAATSGAARAQAHREGHDRNRPVDRQRDGQSATRRDHGSSDRHSTSQNHRSDRSRQSESGGGGWNGQGHDQQNDSRNRPSRQYDSRQGSQQRSSNYERSYGGHGGHGSNNHGGYGGHHGYDNHGHGGHGYNAYGYNAYGYYNTYGYNYGVGYVPTYRYLYGGAYYNTNDYGATLLRNSVNYGYQQGLALAYQARAANWGYDYYRNCDAYRAASYGYQAGYIDPVQYSYYYRVGFERGYREGFYANGPGYYAAYRPGPVDLVVGVLDVILNLQPLGHGYHH